jgi:hypothetical protein
MRMARQTRCRIVWGGTLLGLPVVVAVFSWADGLHPPARRLASLPPTVEAAPRAWPIQAAATAFFEARIRPVLENTCFRCHGGDKVRGGLRVDSRAALLRGGATAPAVILGDADQSLLIQALRYAHEEIKMPPAQKLPPAVIADFAAWVSAGAPWPARLPPGAFVSVAKKHWAFQPPAAVEPPAAGADEAANPVDRFVLARLRQNGLEPAGPADRRTLLRRVTFDLTGLPPTPEDVDAFVTDSAPDAYERVVERLLASPRYGERWARHWLDVVRYADTGGFEADYFYPNAWQYRDYVIRALNADMAFDRFLQEQLAGDELWPGDPEAVRATGLFCIGPALGEAAMVDNQLEYDWLTDAVDTTGAAFLGLTLGCARCHDHKYDPIAQKDYFALQAIFAASDRPYPAKIRLGRLKALNGLLSEAPLPKHLENDPRCTVRTDEQVGLRLFHRAEPYAVRLLHRGELSKPGPMVQPAFPAALAGGGTLPDLAGVPAGQRRAALARWLTKSTHPLTARVLVNRVWGWHFGQALVRTPNDFGIQGEPPTHPELLDWLARDFVAHGWSLKHLHRRIVLSRTYRMASVAAGRGLDVDPRNRLLWHFPRQRLQGEAIRDALLACAGSLNGKVFGPPVVPPLSSQELTGLFDSKSKWPVTRDETEHTRRSVYILVRRTFIYPLFGAFDPPEMMTSCPQRMPTVVPAQALTLLNSPLAREQALAFAGRLLRECGPEPEALAARAWRLAFGRDITAKESDRAVVFLQRRTEAMGGAGPALASARESALAELCLALFNANEFVFVD